MTYTAEHLRAIFQQKFNMQAWYEVLQSIFQASALRSQPEALSSTSETERGFYLGHIDTTDNYKIGLFYYRIQKDSVAHKRVGLRQLVRSFINQNFGLFDAALAVFESDNDWRFSFISDIKGDATSPKRYTYIFGDSENQYKTPIGRFLSLNSAAISYKDIKDAFSVEALTKQFYNDLFDWYQWAVDEHSGITFPNNVSTPDDDKEDIDMKIIRLLTRIIFVWFIKQKDLVPECIFDCNFLRTILKDFDEFSETDGNYYNAILQNLFFATLNRAIEDENGKRRFAHNVKKDVKTLYRYAELFTISEDEVIELFSHIPFLNGGLFECLDKVKTLDGVERAYYYDGFSRNATKFANGRYSQRAVVPNNFFFKPEKGLFAILNRYNFTIEENTPNEQQVALDPELLGKVFENLLGAYNPETQETARNQSGSFYTPREIVDFMTDESLKAYLGRTPIVESLFNDDFVKDPTLEAEYKSIKEKLEQIKILDPACGSGAFPMGLLNRIVDILKKISPEASIYNLKLTTIENCIYGSDIQSIATQISKLRFFISLICDCEKDDSKPNFGIPTLPNLETKFVAANSLLSKKKRQQQLELFEDPRIQDKKDELAKVRHLHFSAKTANQKRELRLLDEQLRKELSELLANSLFAPDDALQLASWNPYDQNTVASFFDPEWMFDVKDFDIVIGNPPYIQLQNNGGELAQLYQPCNFQTFARTGDIYCLFYERGWQLLKPNGHLCYITSNKWMRAGYGEKTREFFAAKTDPQLLIDFSGTKVFESATVDVNILLFEKKTNTHNTTCAVVNKQNSTGINNLSDFVKQNGEPCSFTSGDSWVILSPIEQSIKQKIEAVGTPLTDWDIQINYGIKTGCNEAFIIDEAKRSEILNNCQSQEEREKTAELIRPILRGRDIKRYGYDWAGLYLIWIPWHFPLHQDSTIQGASQKAENLFREQYPSVYNHLLQYKNKLSSRNQAETGIRYEWYALQRWGANYWEDFDLPKIVWKRVGSILRFAYDKNRTLVLDSTCFATGKYIDFLVCILNSPMGHYLLQNAPKTGTGDLLISVQAIDPIAIPIPEETAYNRIVDLLNKYLSGNDCMNIMNTEIFDLYRLSSEEKKYIMSLGI